MAHKSSSHALRNMAGADETQEFVAKVGNRIEHERTAPVDYRDAVLTTVGGRRGADAALAVASMHPHVLDAELGALSHRAVCLVWRSGDHDGVHSSRNAPQIAVTMNALNLVRVGVDREYLVTTV